MRLSYLSIAVNIPDQGCYRRVHWGLTVSADEFVTLMLGSMAASKNVLEQ